MNQEHKEHNIQESEPQSQIEVYFPDSLRTVENLLTRLQEVRTEGGTTFLLKEYDLKFSDVIQEAQNILRTAMQKGVNVIMAPDNHESGNSVSWEQRKLQLQEAGIEFEADVVPIDGRMETIGFYFGSEGKIFAFPKSWELRPVHKIPSTEIGVSICGEIGSLTDEDLKGVKVVYNPSREADDPDIKFRMMGLANPNITREDISNELLKDEYYQSLTDDSLNHEADEYYNPQTDSPEARKGRFDVAVSKAYKIAREQKSDTSIYAKNIHTTIPIIRSDSDRTNGVLNPFGGLKIDNLESSDGGQRMKTSFPQ